MRLRRLVAAGVGLLLAAAACSDTSTGPGTLTVVVTPPDILVEAGDTVRLTATLQDASGRSEQASSISWSSSDARIATVSEDGLVTGSSAGGPVTITATVDATSGRATVTVVAGDPEALSIQTQPSTTAASGAAFDRQPVVQVVDARGNPVSEAGIVVTAVLVDGSGSLSNGTATTDVSGRAIFSGVAIDGPLGDYRLGFEAPGLDSDTSNVISLAAGPPASATILTQPSPTAQNGTALPQQPVVGITDEWGNPVVGADVTASIASGGGTLGGTATISTDGQGAATFTDLSITGPVGDHTLSFTAGAGSVESATIALGVGPPASVTMVTQPASVVENAVVFPRQPVVLATDAGGNPSPGYDVTVAIESGGGTLDGTTTVTTDEAGTATYTDLTITGTVGTRTLRFTHDAVSVTSDVVEVVAGEPATVVILNQPPSTSVSGVTFTQSPSAQVQDVSGNPIANEDVTATIVSGGGALGGTTTVSTDGSGTATFSNLSITTSSPGPRTIAFTSSGLEDISGSVHVAYGQGTYLDVQYCGTIAAQRMDVFIPDNGFSRPLPVAAYIHGGSWVSGDNGSGLQWDAVRDELVSRGYVVVSVEYRLATETTNKWPAQIHDVKCALRHLRAEADDYGFDGVRIGVWGASAGGHLVSMLGVTDAASGLEGNEGFPGWSSRVEAVATLAGISDLTQGPDHPELNFSGPEKVFNTWPGPSSELTDASPISWITSDDPPFLILHGTEDTLVDPAQAQRLFDGLDATGANPTLQLVLNGGHSFQDVGVGTPTPSQAEITQQIADFLDTHVRFNP